MSHPGITDFLIPITFFADFLLNSFVMVKFALFEIKELQNLNNVML